MAYSTRRFVLCLTLCHFVLVFLVLLALRLPRLGTRELILVFSYVCSICACLDLSVPSSSWGLGRAAVCDCGTPWTFPLPFFYSLGMSFEEFQDGRHGSHLRYKNGTILVILNFMSLRCIPSSSGSI